MRDEGNTKGGRSDLPSFLPFDVILPEADDFGVAGDFLPPSADGSLEPELVVVLLEASECVEGSIGNDEGGGGRVEELLLDRLPSDCLGLIFNFRTLPEGVRSGWTRERELGKTKFCFGN